MKKLLLGFIFVILALFISGGAGALTIDDSTNGPTTYWGGSPGSGEDVIGYPSWFSIEQLKATQTLTTTTVVLSGDYFYNIYINSSPLKLPGDLYISTTGWHVSTTDSPHYPTDTFLSTEGWNYVVTYDRPDITSVSWNMGWGPLEARLYPLDNFGGITMTTAWRYDQAWRGGYNSNDTPLIGTAKLTIDNTNPPNSSLTLTFPNLPVPLESLGFHFTMECGNDVVEGAATPIPEPATMLLLGSGLIGLVGFARKKFRK
jgi:hypothetical protein